MANSFLGRKARTHGIRRQRGMSLLETAAVLSIASVAMGMFANTMADNAEQVKAKGVAEKTIEVQNAAHQYVATNQNALMLSTAGGPQVFTADQLRTAGFLPPGFRNFNGYNQQYSLIVRQVTVNGVPRLDAVVTTHGGTRIPDRQLARIAGYIGASGGFVPSAGGATAYGASAGANIVGFQGGWNAQSSNFGSTIAAGSVVATLGFSDTGIVKDYLYRNDSGGTEGNTMRAAINMAGGTAQTPGATPINMGGNNINSAGVVTARAAGVGLSPGSQPAGIDIWAQQGIRAGSSLQAGTTVHAGTSMHAGTSVQAGSHVQAGTYIQARDNITTTTGNLEATAGGVNASGNITTSGGNLVAQVGNVQASAFVDSNNALFSLDPNANSRLLNLRVDDLSAEYLDVSKCVYGIGGITRPSATAPCSPTSGVKLKDLLPRWVAYGGYGPNSTNPGVSNVVPMPACPAGIATPRIVLNPMRDSFKFNVAVDQARATAVTNVTRDASNNLYVYYADFLTGVGSSGEKTTIARQYSVTPGAGSWTVNLTGTARNDAEHWYVHATTYCEFTY